MRLVPKNFSVNLPWGLGGVSLDLSEEAEKAAWALYVELNTRITTKLLAKGQGSVREALTSLHTMFDITRATLKDGGVDVARSRRKNESLGSIAMSFLNDVVRPELVKWHSGLSAHESATWQQMIGAGKSIPNHPALAGALVDESAWDGYARFYDELNELQVKLRRYVDILGALAGVSTSGDVQPTEQDD